MKKRINIKEVLIKNFFAYGNQEEIFDFSQGYLNLIKGKMGAGKSSLFSTIPYSLFGKVDRKIPLNKIVNIVNRKDTEINLSFEINNKKIKIIRGIYPQIQEIFINGEKITEITLFQEKLKSLFSISRELFFKIIYLNPKISESFYTLRKNSRDKFLDIFIDTELIEKMKELNIQENSLIDKNNFKIQGIEEQLNKRTIDLNKKLQNIEKSNLLNNKLQLQKEIEKISESLSQLQSKYKELVIEEEKIEKNISIFNKEKNSIINELKIIQKVIISQRSSISHLSKESKKISEMKLKEEICKKEIDSIVTNFQEKIKIKKEELIKIENKEKLVSEQVKKIEFKIKELDSQLGESEIIKEEINKIDIKFRKKEFELKEIKFILSKDEEYLIEIKNDFKELGDELDKIKIEKIVNTRKSQITFLTKNVLNSRIKPYLISRIYPFLQKQINRYFDLFNFPLLINLSKDEEPLFRAPGRPSFVYENFSDGERILIDLATMLSFKELLEFQIGIEINILIFDEYITHLPQEQLNIIIPKIKEIAEMKNLNIFMSSHNPNIQSQEFDNIYEIKKINGFSKIFINDEV